MKTLGLFYREEENKHCNLLICMYVADRSKEVGRLVVAIETLIPRVGGEGETAGERKGKQYGREQRRAGVRRRFYSSLGEMRAAVPLTGGRLRCTDGRI